MTECKGMLVLWRSGLESYGCGCIAVNAEWLSLLDGLELHHVALGWEMGSTVVCQDYVPLWLLEGD